MNPSNLWLCFGVSPRASTIIMANSTLPLWPVLVGRLHRFVDCPLLASIDLQSMHCKRKRKVRIVSTKPKVNYYQAGLTSFKHSQPAKHSSICTTVWINLILCQRQINRRVSSRISLQNINFEFLFEPIVFPKSNIWTPAPPVPCRACT